jgi:putative ABC transport system permease protein
VDWNARVRAAFGGNAPEDDVVAELAQHAEGTYGAALAEGLSNEAALERVDEHVAAWRASASGLVRRRARPAAVDPPRSRGLTGLLEELRHAARRLAREPRHSGLVVVALAVGIGAATALFSVVSGVLLEPLPWPGAERLVRLSETREGATRAWPWKVTNGTYLALEESGRSIDGLAAWGRETVTWTGEGEAARVRVASVTSSLFPLLGARPVLGTTFSPDDEATGGVVLLSYGLWQRRFGGRPDVIGRPVVLDGEPHRVVGVMPRGFAFPDREASAWKPFHVMPSLRPDGRPAGISIFSAMARLRPGASPRQLSEEGTALAGRAPDPGLVTMAMFGTRGKPRLTAVPALEALTAEVRPALLVLMAAMGLLLAAATANVASLQLVRATARRRELAVRASLGAGAGRLARMLLLESLVLAVLGGAAGLALAAAGPRVLGALLPADFPRVDAIAVDGRVAAFAASLAVACGLGAGLLPALFARRLRLAAELAEDALASVGAGRSGASRVRTVILAGQVAVAAVLLLGALQLGRSFLALLEANRGYDARHLLTMRLPMPEPGFPPARRAQLLDEVLERLRGLPGVSEAAAANVLPLHPYDAMVAWSMVSPGGDAVRQVNASVRQVSPGYFRALGRRLVEGRLLLATDTRTSAPVVVVNREFARRHLGDRAVGARIPARLDGERDEWTVVGVVEDMVHGSVADPLQPEVIVALAQLSPGQAPSEPGLLLRTAVDPETLAPTVRAVLRELDPALVPEAVLPMTRLVTDSLARPRLYTVLLAVFAGCALLVAAIGLFGALSYGVALRTREIGVRMALGARPRDVALMVAAQALRVGAAGLGAGLLASLGLGRAISGMLYGVRPHDGVSLVLVPAVLLLLAAAVSIAPALRAAGLDPQRALREG